METRKLLWPMALVFSVILLLQYIELPYGYVLSSLLSFGKSQVTSAGGFLAGAAAASNINPTTEVLHNATKLPDPPNRNRTDESNKSSNASSGAANYGRAAGYPPQDIPVKNRSSKDETSAGNKSVSLSMFVNNSNAGPRTDLADSVYNSSSAVKSPAKRKWIKGPPAVVVPISAMNDMLRQSRASYLAKPRWPSRADGELLNAQKLIESVRIVDKIPRVDDDVYRNYSAFVRSYELMEQSLKIYVYDEGKRPIFHQPEMSGIYASEGWFMKQIEESERFRTKNASDAHLFYLPFSSRVLQETLYVKYSHSRKNMVAFLSDYLRTIAAAYPFWNRTSGADHFLVACHDWAPSETKRIMRNCIRALCNADIRGGLQFGKDVSLPEIFVRNASDPLKDVGGKPPSQRRTLAFFAGNMHGYFRPILLDYWQDKDPEMKIFGKLRPGKGRKTYIQYMKSSKYCISAKGYEAYTPRVMEAIFYECVPVIISDNYVPPFFETLNWESFAVFVLEKDTPNLKRILESIPEKTYLKMQERVRRVQKHFLWHMKPVKFDVFHMILHSIWYTRVFQIRPS
ncbi:probable glycosyltransferase At3g07620 isoform X2 [Andrographis paniculata]|uniref:probable glycosyltransferase At3g07620 isoform X2 n=1 Tax=Andrographis paniculata TaxID=175694 RepID=UPI0021E6F324|nr:probable glycosyltransferase At3g07620 isoform X2 [Andrographis paniculata]